MTSARPAGVPGAYGDAMQIKKQFTNSVDDDMGSGQFSTGSLRMEPHPVWGTLAAEKFTEGMQPAMASVYPGKNGPAGVAGDFDKIYLPRPLVRKVHSGRPLMKGETAPKPTEPWAESFHDTISVHPPVDTEVAKPYMVPKYAADFPLETNMDPQRLHSGFMNAPTIPTTTFPAKPSSPLPQDLAPSTFPPDSPARKLTASTLSDAPFHSTYTSEEAELAKKQSHIIKTHAAGARQGKRFTDKLW